MTTATRSGLERRRWTPEQKYRIVMDSLAAGANVASVARNHDVNPNLIYAWRRQARKSALCAEPRNGVDFVPVTIASTRSVVPVSSGNAVADARLEVVLRNGRMLRVPEGVVPSRVGVLADALEGVEQ
jgi:transposase